MIFSTIVTIREAMLGIWINTVDTNTLMLVFDPM